MSVITQSVINRADRCAAEGQCALGVRYILDSMGIPNGRGNAHDYLTRLEEADSSWMRMNTIRYDGQEYTMDDLSQLTRSELDEVLSNSPDVPPGAVIVYDKSADYTTSGGSRYLAADRDRDGYLDRNEEQYLSRAELDSFDHNQDGSISSSERRITGGDRYGHVEIAVDGAGGDRQFVSDKARETPGGSVPQNIAGIFIHPDLGGPDTRQQIVDATGADMRARIESRRNGLDTLPDLTSSIEDAFVPDLSGLDPEMGELFNQLMTMVFGTLFQCLFNGLSGGDEDAPRRLETPRRAGDITAEDQDIARDIEGPEVESVPVPAQVMPREDMFAP